MNDQSEKEVSQPITFTVLSSDLPQTKTVSLEPSGEIKKDSPKFGYEYQFKPIVCDSIHAFSDCFQEITTNANQLIVLGEPKPELDLNTKHRRLKANFQDVHTRLLPLDIDSYHLEGADVIGDPVGTVEQVISNLLGPNFEDVSCVWQFTTGQKPTGDEIRLRLFFVLSAPRTTPELKRWGAHTSEKIDLAVFQSQQPIFTANPIINGKDWLPQRFGFLDREHETVELVIPKSQPKRIPTVTLNGESPRSMKGNLSLIGDHEGGQGFHEPIRNAIFHGVRAKIKPDKIKSAVRKAVFEAQYTGSHSRTKEQYCEDYYLDDSIRGAVERVFRPASYPHRPALPLNEARNVLSETVEGFFPSDINLTLKAPAGIGKTTAVCEAIRKLLRPDEYLNFFAPTKQQGEEVRDSLLKLGVSARVIYGRDHLSSGQPLCSRNELASKLNKKGLGVYNNLCNQGGQKCPHYNQCRYINQFKEKESVWIYNHSHLTWPSSRLEKDRKAAISIIDENFTLNDIFENQTIKRQHVEECSEIPSELKQALLNGFDDQNILEAIPELPNALELLKAAQEAIDSKYTSPFFLPDQSDDDIFSILRGHKPRPKAATLINTLVKIIEGEPAPNRITHISKAGEQPEVAINYSKKLSKLEETRILHIDADAQEKDCGLFFDSEFKEIHCERNAYVIQCNSRTFSKYSLTDSRDADELLGQVQTFINQVCAEHGKTLVVTYKAVEDHLQVPNGEVIHFGNLRGLDKYKDYQAIIILGRNQPNIKAAVQVARAKHYLDEAPIEDLDSDYKEDKHYRMRDGSLTPGVSVRSHPDPRVSSVIEAIREQETGQAVDRLRLLNDGPQKRVFLLSDAPLDMTVDEARPWKEMYQPSKLDLVLNHFKSFVPVSPQLLTQELPSVFSNQQAAKDWLRHNFWPLFKQNDPTRGGNFLIKLIIRRIPLLGDGLLQAKHRSSRRWFDVCFFDNASIEDVERALGDHYTVRIKPGAEGHFIQTETGMVFNEVPEVAEEPAPTEETDPDILRVVDNVSRNWFLQRDNLRAIGKDPEIIHVLLEDAKAGFNRWEWADVRIKLNKSDLFKIAPPHIYLTAPPRGPEEDQPKPARLGLSRLSPWKEAKKNQPLTIRVNREQQLNSEVC